MTLPRWTRYARVVLPATCASLTLGSVASATETEFLDPARALHGEGRALEPKPLEVRTGVAPKTLLKRFGLFGVPGILFFDAKRQQQVDARVIGFLPPKGFSYSLAVAGI